MSTKRIILASKPHETSSLTKWLIALAAGAGLTWLGTSASSDLVTGIGAAILGSGLLYANAQVWSSHFGLKR
ncbi:MAG: hypothetical protein LUG50_07780 [Planctomycetaceae bacterium]|nr:hypothetical protein [Planctomycetaceae bacterium]